MVNLLIKFNFYRKNRFKLICFFDIMFLVNTMIVKVLKMDHQGRGIAKVNDKTVFIYNALPDEVVDIRIIKENNLLRYDKCYSVQCGAFHNKSNASNLKAILNNKLNRNIFSLEYDGKMYYVRAFKSHDIQKIREWISANITVLPLGSFAREV